MTPERKIIKNKVGLLELAGQLGNVSRVCKILGYSRDSLYRFQQLYGTGGEEALHEISKRKPILKNQVAPEIERAVVQLALDRPAWSQVRVSNELRKKNLFILPGSVRSPGEAVAGLNAQAQGQARESSRPDLSATFHSLSPQ